jgi:hypothetical protein
MTQRMNAVYMFVVVAVGLLLNLLVIVLLAASAGG